MSLLLDAVYLVLITLLSPWLAIKALTTGKYRRGMWQRLTGMAAHTSEHGSGTVLFHGVSVGEIHLLRTLVAAFRQRFPNHRCVISSTTDTGFDEACRIFPELEVIRFPLDFSWSVKRVLRRIKPSLIVLAECELWPNFLLAARREGVPVTVINARISPRSFRRYRRIRFAARWMFGMVARFAVQTQAYSDNLQLLGVPAERLAVTGSVKYDGATGDRSNPRTAALRGLLGISPGELVWVAGSTQAPEEEIALAVFRRLQTEFPTLRLILVPRQKDRFDDVAQTLKRSGATFARRSELTTATTAPIVLVDTIGELNAVWGLANVAFVGGSLDGKRGGQNMIEPAAYGAAVVFGPHVWNFRDAAARLIEARAAIQISDAAELEAVVRQLFDDPDTRRDLGDNARRLVRDQQGATIRTVELLAQMLERSLPSRVAG